MDVFTSLLEKAISWEDNDIIIPAAIYSVVSKNGDQLYLQGRGSTGDVGSDKATVDENTVFWMASQTKLMTTIASMQCVERGLIGLDDDVTPVLPELAELGVLETTSNEDGSRQTKKRKEPITLRLLLTHQSGIGYDVMSPELAEWSKRNGISNTTLDCTMVSATRCPLLFEPGTAWMYGAGIDWAGELVSRLNQTTLEAYMRQNIWGPLDMTSTTFRPEGQPDIASRIIACFARNEDGRGVTPIPPVIPIPAQKECGGHGCWSTIKDYSKLLKMLLADGGTVLKKELVNEIFKPQIRDRDSLKSVIHSELKPVLGSLIPVETDVDHGLAGLVVLEDIQGRRRAGTLQWSGAANIVWWVDRKAGIAATGFLHLMPPGDPKATELHLEFEKSAYKAFG